MEDVHHQVWMNKSLDQQNDELHQVFDIEYIHQQMARNIKNILIFI
jgi:hypothetical protein